MASRWEDQHLLVRLSGVIRFCCDPDSTQELPLGPDLPNTEHRLEGPRYTILPSIWAVSPWDDEERFLHDQAFGGSDPAQVVAPTPALPSVPGTPLRPPTARDAALDATLRFYNALRAVLHGSGPGTVRALREGTQESGVEAVAAGLVPHLQESSEPVLTPQHAPGLGPAPAMTPLLQVCLALGVLVVVMVVLFHWHHFRRDCTAERRALRRVARRYQVAARAHDDDDDDDVEKNEQPDATDVSSGVTDVTL